MMAVPHLGPSILLVQGLQSKLFQASQAEGMSFTL